MIADRLRALENELSPFAFVESESLQEAVAISLANYRKFQRTLPALIAVVEAAEALVVAEGLYEAEGGRQHEVDALRQALAALGDWPKAGYDTPMFGGTA